MSALATASVALAMAVSIRAQSSYSNAVMSLNPAGYWPMHEVEPAAPGDIETNYGTLGLVGTGYYPDWASGVGGFVRGFSPGPLSNDTTACVSFLHTITSGTTVVYTNFLFVPHSSPFTTLTPPFSVECWVEVTNTLSAATYVWGQDGFDALNGPGANSGSADGYGITLNANGTSFYLGLYSGSGQANPNNSGTYPINQWYYAVVTCATNTNTLVYIDGNATTSAYAGVGKYLPDNWTPLTIGGGRSGSRAFPGYVADFAIYTNALSASDIANKYSIGTNAASVAGQYFDAVTDDNPVVFYRMNAPTVYTAPASASLPALYNYGTTNGVAVGNGVYSAGTMPGIMPGPINNNGVPYGGVMTNLAMLSGISTFGDAGFAPAYNPTGSNTSFSVTAIFRSYPCDNRVESIAGHGTNSWQLDMATNGVLVFNAGNGNAAAGGIGHAAGDLATVGVYNDGNWHQVVAVNETNEIWIYVDGKLDTNGTPANIAVTNIIPGNSSDVMIGSDPIYTNVPAGAGRQFAGQICDVAFFARGLTANQVQLLYNSCGIAPFFTQQPVSGTVNQGSAFTNLVTVGGSPTLSYQWFTNGVALAGQTNADLILNPAEPGNSATNYYLVVTNLYGSITSTVVSLTVYGAPVILSQLPMTYTNQPDAQNPNFVTNFLTLYAGANPTFSLSVAGPSPAYYWTTNGVADGAVTNGSLQLTNLPIGALNLYCIVSNFIGEATSVLWSASMIADPPNSNSTGIAPYPQAVLALNPIGYWRLNDTNLDGPDNNDGNNGYICHDYVGGNNGIYTNVALGNAGYNPIEDPSDSSANFGADPDGNNSDFGDEEVNSIAGINFGSPTNTSVAFTVEAWVNGYAQNNDAGLVTLGWGGGGEQFDLDCGSDTSPISHGFRFLVRDASGATHGVNTTVEPLFGTWYHLAGVVDEISNQDVAFYINGQLVGTASLPSGSGILSSTYLMSIGSRLGSATTNYDLQFSGEMNDVAVFNYALSSNQLAGEYSAADIAPFFAQEPVAGTNIDQGGPLSVSAGVGGSLPLLYQWYHAQSGAPVPGQTNSTLFLASESTNDEFYLAVTNAFGGTNSSVVTVSVTGGLNASVLPANITVYAGEPESYSASASGTFPLYYQWWTNGVAVPNATNTSFSLLTPPGNTAVSCVVTNAYNGYSSISVSVTLTGVPFPTNLYQAAVLSNNPVAFWRLNEPEQGNGDDGVVAYDYVGEHNGVYTNSELGFPVFDSVSSTDTAALFGVYSNSDSYMGEADQSAVGVPNINFGGAGVANAEFSVECWVDVTNNASGGFVTKGYGDGGEQFCLDTGASSRGFRFFVRNAAGTAEDANSSLIPVAGQWYHLVGVCDETNGLVILYLDGVSNAAGSIVQGSGLIDSTNATLPAANLVSIGSRTSSKTATSMTLQNGALISDVALYNYPLSAAQVAAHFHASGVLPPVNSTPTNIVFAVTNNQLYLSWPASHTGWQLQAQTNSLAVGIGANWVNIIGSTTTNQFVIPINLTNGSVFYRLTY